MPTLGGCSYSVLAGSQIWGVHRSGGRRHRGFQTSSSWCVTENCPIPKRQLNRLQQETKIWQHSKQLRGKKGVGYGEIKTI